MLDRLMKLFRQRCMLPEPEIMRGSEFGDGDARLAAAALLVHASKIDGEVTAR